MVQVFATENEFIGLTKNKAQDLCEKKNMIFQLVRKDDSYFLSYPSDPNDKRLDRVFVELDQGKITKAIIT